MSRLRISNWVPVIILITLPVFTLLGQTLPNPVVSPTPGFTNPLHLSPSVMTFFDLLNKSPMLLTLLVLMLLDLFSGCALAIYNRKLSSTTSWRGMTRKIFMLLIVSVAAVIEQFAAGIPLGKLACMCYIYTEAISIMENAALAGVPLPQALVNTLVKARAEQKTLPTTVILPAGQTADIHVTPPIGSDMERPVK